MAANTLHAHIQVRTAIMAANTLHAHIQACRVYITEVIFGFYFRGEALFSAMTYARFATKANFRRDNTWAPSILPSFAE